MKEIFNADFLDFMKALNSAGVRYLLVGGYAVVLHGYSRSTGDLDVWVEQTQDNYSRLLKAFIDFGVPVSAISEKDFLGSSGMDVFTFGRPPVAIDIMTAVKGLQFAEAYKSADEITVQDTTVRLLNLKSLIKAKQESGRYKDLDDIEHLSKN